MTQDPDILAAEYVLGLLEEEERLDAEHRLNSDIGFQQAVGRWQKRFLEIDDSASSMAIDHSLWLRIEDSLVAESQPMPQMSPHIDPRRPFHEFWQNLRFWRTAGLVGAFASLVLAIGLGAMSIRSSGQQPTYVAVLMTDQNRPAAVVNAYADGSAELIPLETIAVPQGRALEIWTLWDRARGPVSIGLINQARTVRLRLDHLPATSLNQIFEITLEPAEGSPVGRPTGPVLMKGVASTAL